MTRVATEPLLLPTPAGDRFCLLTQPGDGVAPSGTVLFLPPFAEEMNKCRRLVAEGARALAAAGLAVLQIDLGGCGDSEGEFEDAAWSSWLDDVGCAWALLERRFGRVDWLWGLRAGCLLASAYATRATPARGLVFWQPVLSGRQHLDQFLRLKVAGELTVTPEDRTSTKALRERLSAGAAVELAGYTLAPAVALGLDDARLELERCRGIVHWLETDASGETRLSPASDRYLSALHGGPEVRRMAVTGPAFWQTVEIEEAPALVAATVQALSPS